MLGRGGDSCIEILENSNRIESEKTSLIIGKPLKPPQMSMTSAVLRTRRISKHKLDKRRHRKEAAARAQRAEPWLELQCSSHTKLAHLHTGIQTVSLRDCKHKPPQASEARGSTPAPSLKQTDPTARRLPARVTSALPWQC